MSNLEQHLFEPPIGGANLECLLKCERPIIETASVILKFCDEFGFQPIGKVAFLAYGDDPIEPIMIESADRKAHFLDAIKELSPVRCIMKLEGVLSDVETSMCLLFDATENVLVVSVPEDMLWEFGSSEADILRLKAFAQLCDVIANYTEAFLGYIGTEHVHPEDMVLDGDSGVSHINDQFFSEKRIQELFDWYVTFYIKRWKK